MDCIVSWIAQNYIELLAASLGIIGIFLQIKQNPWYWFTSIIMVVLYIFVFCFVNLILFFLKYLLT